MANEIKTQGEYTLGFLWTGSNNGSVGSRNHRSTPVTVYICHKSESPFDAAIQYEAGKADSKSKADSIARKFIRDNNLREKLKEMC